MQGADSCRVVAGRAKTYMRLKETGRVRTGHRSGSPSRCAAWKGLGGVLLEKGKIEAEEGRCAEAARTLDELQKKIRRHGGGHGGALLPRALRPEAGRVPGGGREARDLRRFLAAFRHSPAGVFQARLRPTTARATSISRRSTTRSPRSRRRIADLSFTAWKNLGSIQQQLEQWNDAAATWQKLVETFPERDGIVEVLFDLGFCYNSGGKNELAYDVYSRIPDVATSEEQQGRAHYWAGMSLKSMGRYDEAIREFLRVPYLKTGGMWGVTSKLEAAGCCEAKGDLAQARTIYESVLSANGPASDWGRVASDGLKRIAEREAAGGGEDRGSSGEEGVARGMARENLVVAGRAGAQPQEHHRHDTAEQARRDHGPERFGQIVARLRHDLRRGAAPLRRESLSSYARQFLEQMEKPDVDSIEGLSPAISIDQKTSSRNPRSTVGTITEIHDYLRVLFARAGEPHCPGCGRRISRQTVAQIVDRLRGAGEGTRLEILAPVVRGRKGEHRALLGKLMREGFTRVRVDGEVRELEPGLSLEKTKKHTIEVVVDRLKVKAGVERRLADSVETAAAAGGGVILVLQGRRGVPLQPRILLPLLRQEPRRDQPADVLLQLPVRRLPRVPRARHADRLRARARRPRRSLGVAAGAHRAGGPAQGKLVPLPARGARGEVRFLARYPVRLAPARGAGRRPRRDRRRRSRSSTTSSAGGANTSRRGRGSFPTCGAAITRRNRRRSAAGSKRS